jgi:hypothetical protein
MALSPSWLSEIAGWQAVKSGRALRDTGAVLEVSISPGPPVLVSGKVADGRRTLAAGLRIRSRSDVENLCTCPTSRREGQICAHSIALALAANTASAAQPSPSTPASTSTPTPIPTPQAAPSHHKDTPVTPYQILIPEKALLALARGRLGIELHQVTPGDAPAEAPADLALAAWLAPRVSSQTPDLPLMLALQGDALSSFLEAAAGHPRIAVKPATPSPQHAPRPLQIAPAPQPLAATLHHHDGQITLALDPPAPDESRFALGATPYALHLSPSSALLRQLIPPPPCLKPFGWTAERLASSPPPPLSRPASWVAQHLPDLQLGLHLAPADTFCTHLRLAPAQAQIHATFEGSLRNLEVSLSLQYPHLSVHFNDGKWRAADPADPAADAPWPDPDRPWVFLFRDPAAEAAPLAELHRAGFALSRDGRLLLTGEPAVLAFWASTLPALQRRWHRADLGPRFAQLARSLRRVRPSWQVTSSPHLPPAQAADTRPSAMARSGSSWLSLSLAFSPEGSPDTHIPAAEIARLLRGGGRPQRDASGHLLVIDQGACLEAEAWLAEADLAPSATPGQLQVPPSHAAFVLAELAPEDQAADLLPAALDPRQLLAPIPQLAPLLRPYQIEALRWLADLSSRSPGGLLADDMGLGKTVQTLAFLQILRHHRVPSPPHQPALIVAPTSLLPNWAEEAARWTPDLKVITLHGQSRHALQPQAAAADLVITSYATLARDLAWHQEQFYAAAVLDEASLIRNPKSQIAKACFAIDASFRLALTGTPIENDLADLWSIFHFAVPGYLGRREPFLAAHHPSSPSPTTSPSPIAAAQARHAPRHATPPPQPGLSRRLQPYILRRTKAQVLDELPEKIERVQPCALHPTQQQAYQQLLDQGHAAIDEARRRSGQAAARAQMFTLLLRLRQLCDHPNLLQLGTPQLDAGSGKGLALAESIASCLEAGRKVLVFSQFVSMLGLVRAHLDAAATPYAYLDGTTRDRAAPVRSFQQDPDTRLFLISLKAGGYGLNLTAAEHVFLVEPWWNPAVEQQAIDRAHRLGQLRAVEAVRFITRGTVEERILALQAHKRGLADAVLDDHAPRMDALSDTDLEQLLR